VTRIVSGANLDASPKNGVRLTTKNGTEQVASNVRATNDYSEVGEQDVVIMR
jgi:hypothetical protein